MSALISSWTPSDFAITWEGEAWLLHPIAPKKQFCMLRTLYGGKKKHCMKKKMFLLDTIPMAGDTWLDFYNLFQKYLCVDSVSAMCENVVFQKIEKMSMEKICGTQTWPNIDLGISGINQLFLPLPHTKSEPSTTTLLIPPLFFNSFIDVLYNSPIWSI